MTITLIKYDGCWEWHILEVGEQASLCGFSTTEKHYNKMTVRDLGPYAVCPICHQDYLVEKGGMLNLQYDKEAEALTKKEATRSIEEIARAYNPYLEREYSPAGVIQDVLFLLAEIAKRDAQIKELTK